MNKYHRVTYLVAFICLLSLFVFPTLSKAENAGDWTIWEEKEQVPIDKTWNITFNDHLDIHSITSQNVYVEDANGEKVDVEVLWNGENGILVRPPLDNYKSHHTYTLYLTNRIYAKTGTPLKSAVKMNFTTTDQTENIVEPFIPREDSTNTLEMNPDVKDIDLSADIQSVDRDSITLSKTDIQQLQEGDIFFLPPTQDAPFGMAKKVTAIENNGSQSIISTETPTTDEMIEDIDISQTVSANSSNFKPNPLLTEPFQTAALPNSFSTAGMAENNGKIEFLLNGNENSNGIIIKFEQYFIKNLGVRLNGTLKINEPRVNVDIETAKFIGIPYDFDFQRLEFSATEELDLSLSASWVGNHEEKLPLGELPIPLLGTPYFGVNVGLYLTFSANGEIGLQYSFHQSLDVQVGIIDNPEMKEFYPYNYSDFSFKQKDLSVNANGRIQPQIETGIYLLLGDISLASLNVKAGVSAEMKAKPQTFVKTNGETETKACYRYLPIWQASGEASFGIELKTQYVEKVGVKSVFNIFNWQKKDTPYSNCNFDRIEVTVDKEKLKRGEQTKLHINAYVDDLYASIPFDDENVTISLDGIHLNKETGILTVPADIEAGRHTIFVTYTDRELDSSVTDYVYVEVDDGHSTEEPPEEEEQDEGQDPLEAPNDQVVYFPDVNLEELIKGELNIQRSDKITTEDMLRLESLAFYANIYIHDLTGLEYAKNLSVLRLQGGQINDISVLRHLTNLSYLDLANNQITDISALSDLTNLNYLGLYMNQISDISALHNFKNLRALNLSHNQISDISALSNLTNLRTLDLGGNQISDISALYNLTSLEKLFLYDNQINDFSVLRHLTNLTYSSIY